MLIAGKTLVKLKGLTPGYVRARYLSAINVPLESGIELLNTRRQIVGLVM